MKVTIMFRGRETVHPELGRRLLDRLAEDVQEIAKVDVPPKLDGRNMTMVLAPVKEAITGKAKPPSSPRPRPQQAEESPEERVPAPASRPIRVTRAEGG